MKKPNSAPVGDTRATDYEDWRSLPKSMTKWMGFALHWASERCIEQCTAELKKIGVSLGPKDVSVLILIQDDGPQTQTALCAALKIEKASMVSVVNDLERLGFAERKTNPSDARANLVTIKPAGAEVLRKVEMISDRVHQQLFSTLTPGERLIFREILEKLVSESTAIATADKL